MVASIVADLRSVAQKCTQLARECSRQCAGSELSLVLQELGIDLMATASELERKFDK
jgi:hypothetical protein